MEHHKGYFVYQYESKKNRDGATEALSSKSIGVIYVHPIVSHSFFSGTLDSRRDDLCTFAEVRI